MNESRISFSDWCRQNGYEALLRQWDYESNQFGPEDISPCSRRLCWWRCEKIPGHKWAEPAERRTHHKSQECPFCSGRFLIGSVNSLAARYPHISEEFDIGRNGISPEAIFPKTNRSYWWRCSHGHSWRATPNSRTSRGGGCPYCGHRLASPEYNLATEFPFVAEEWLYEKNDGFPTDYLPHSEKEAYWRCRYHPDIEWKSKICNRTSSRISNCPVCQKERGTSFPEQVVYYYLKLLFKDAKNRVQIGDTETDIYLPSLNLAIEYDGYYYHDNAGGQERERKKDQILHEAGLTALHIKETPVFQNLPACASVLWCPVKNYKNYLFLQDLMQSLVQWINVRYGLHLITRPDVQRDSAVILSDYMSRRKENSLEQRAPQLAAEWHTERNGQLTPAMISFGSGKKVWWKCGKGHEWKASVSNRYQGGKCPYCSGKKVYYENSFAFFHPKLSKTMWNAEKNASLAPSDVTAGSGKKVWWKCEKGHEWIMPVHDASKGYRCPYCSNHRVSSLNALAIRRPELAYEWNYEKNGALTPSTISFSSGKSVWWRCERGHEWQERVGNRSQFGYGCPYCSGKRPTKDHNLAVLHPILIQEWHPDKNRERDPVNLLPQSNLKVWWMCKKGHEWEATICSRTRGTGCPYCAGKRVWEENSLSYKYPNVAHYWHPSKNGSLTPQNVAPHSSKAVWWMCDRGHEWKRKISYEIKSSACPYCSGRLACKENSLACLFPELSKEWDTAKNGSLAPHDITAKSKRRVWWKCDKGHSWQMDIRTRCSGIGNCPYCMGKRVCEENCLAVLSPHIAAEWDYEKNRELTPALVTNHSSIKVWWKCAKGHSWQALIRSRTVIGSGCPVCAGKAASPEYNLLTEYPDIALDWDMHKNKLPPEQYLPYSNKAVWWKCHICGSGWKAMVIKRTREKSCCPQCGHMSK